MKEAINLNLSSLVKVLHSLDEALSEQRKQKDNLFVRDALIQRFEYTYDLAHKMLKRFLELTEPNSEAIDQMTFSSLIRTGAEKGLLKRSWETWSAYRTARNLTSHTYNESKAIKVCQVIPEFFKEAEFLLHQLQKRSRDA